MAKFKRKPFLLVDAVQAQTDGCFRAEGGMVFYKKTDWLVTRIDGSKIAVDDEIFRQVYEPATDADVSHVQAVTPAAHSLR